MSGCTLSPQCNGSTSGTHAFKHVWFYAKVLLGKQILLAPLFLPGIQIISPCQIGQVEGSITPLRGKAVASGPATILYVSVVQPSWCSGVTELFFSPCVCTVLHLHKPFLNCPPSNQSEKQLAYLLTVSGTVSCFCNEMKKGQVGGGATVLSRALTECLHRQLLHTSCRRWYFDIFLQTPWRWRWIWRNPLVSHVNATEREEKRMKAGGKQTNSFCLQMRCSVQIITVSFKLFPQSFPLSTEMMYVFAVTEVKLSTIYSRLTIRVVQSDTWKLEFSGKSIWTCQILQSLK